MADPFSEANVERTISALPQRGSKDLEVLLKRAEAKGLDRLAAACRLEIAARPISVTADVAVKNEAWSRMVAGKSLVEAMRLAFAEAPLGVEERRILQSIRNEPGISYRRVEEIHGKGDAGLYIGHIVYGRYGFFREHASNRQRMSDLILHRTEGPGGVRYALTDEASQILGEIGEN